MATFLLPVVLLAISGLADGARQKVRSSKDETECQKTQNLTKVSQLQMAADDDHQEQDEQNLCTVVEHPDHTHFGMAFRFSTNDKMSCDPVKCNAIRFLSDYIPTALDVKEFQIDGKAFCDCKIQVQEEEDAIPLFRYRALGKNACEAKTCWERFSVLTEIDKKYEFTAEGKGRQLTPQERTVSPNHWQAQCQGSPEGPYVQVPSPKDLVNRMKKRGDKRGLKDISKHLDIEKFEEETPEPDVLVVVDPHVLGQPLVADPGGVKTSVLVGAVEIHAGQGTCTTDAKDHWPPASLTSWAGSKEELMGVAQAELERTAADQTVANDDAETKAREAEEALAIYNAALAASTKANEDKKVADDAAAAAAKAAAEATASANSASEVEKSNCGMIKTEEDCQRALKMFGGAYSVAQFIALPNAAPDQQSACQLIAGPEGPVSGTWNPDRDHERQALKHPKGGRKQKESLICGCYTADGVEA